MICGNKSDINHSIFKEFSLFQTIKDSSNFENDLESFRAEIESVPKTAKINLDLTSEFTSVTRLPEFVTWFQTISASIRYLTWRFNCRFGNEEQTKFISDCVLSLTNVYRLDLQIYQSLFSDKSAEYLASALSTLVQLHSISLSFIYKKDETRKAMTQIGYDTLNKGISVLPELEVVDFKNFKAINMVSKKLAVYQKTITGRPHCIVDEFKEEISQNKKNITIIDFQNNLGMSLEILYSMTQPHLVDIFLYCFEVPYLTQLSHNIWIQPNTLQSITLNLLYEYLADRTRYILSLCAISLSILPMIPINPVYVLLDFYF